LTLCNDIFKEQVLIILNMHRQICRLQILRNGRCEGEISESILYLLNCEITVDESVNILILHSLGATKMAVNMATSSAKDEEGKAAVRADAYDRKGANGAVWIQATPILMEGVPKLTKEPSVKNSKKVDELN